MKEHFTQICFKLPIYLKISKICNRKTSTVTLVVDTIFCCSGTTNCPRCRNTGYWRKAIWNNPERLRALLLERIGNILFSAFHEKGSKFGPFSPYSPFCPVSFWKVSNSAVSEISELENKIFLWDQLQSCSEAFMTSILHISSKSPESWFWKH